MKQKETSYYLRISQLALTFLALLLEFITIVGFSANYNDAPTHGANFYYWAALILSNLFLGHLTIRFQPRWRYGPYRDEMFFDGFFLSVWISMCFLNISQAFHGESISCSNMNTGPALTRCRLFLSNLAFAWVLVPTFIASLYISISRWNHKVTLSTPMNTANSPPPTKPQSPHVMQKGVLKDGFLVFNDNNKSSKRMSLYSQQNRSTPHMRTYSYPNNFVSSTPNLLSDLSLPKFDHVTTTQSNGEK